MRSFHDLLIIDDIYPSSFSPFRTIEYNHYLWFFDAAVLTMEGSQLWIENTKISDHLERMDIPELHKKRIFDFRSSHDIAARLAYVTFLGNAHKLLPYFEARRLPFILQLYPGGGFAIDQSETDEKLRQVLLSPLCRKVITTQTLTKDYIKEKIGCAPEKIVEIFGGVFDSRVDFDFYRDKRTYPEHKDTIDLCFVAHKYGDDLVSKGYDYFVRMALEIAARLPNVRFHIVGDYSAADISIDGAESLFTYYGRRENSFFKTFYPSMDAIISFNRPFVLMPGAFDGFPTGACLEAGFSGVANIINDPLELNCAFEDGKDLLLLNEDFDQSLSRILDLLKDPAALKSLGEGSWRSFRKVMDLDRQLWNRSKVISDELTKHNALVSIGYAPRSSIDGEPVRALTETMRQRISDLEQIVAAGASTENSVSDRISALEAKSVALAEDREYWRLTAERLASGIPNRIFEKTKTVVRRYLKRRGAK